MTASTTAKISRYSTDERGQTALLALMDFYSVTNLLSISEEMGLEFLKKLESGEVVINEDVCENE